MSKFGEKILSMLLWSWGGTVYFLLEVAFKTVTNEPEKISWTMLILAMILTIPVERCGAQLPWETPFLIQVFACTALVTIAEFIAGCILNIWLGLGIWDYSHMWGNILGQICPQFIAVWFVLCGIFIVAFDWMRYAVDGIDKPHYVWGW